MEMKTKSVRLPQPKWVDIKTKARSLDIPEGRLIRLLLLDGMRRLRGAKGEQLANFLTGKGLR